MQIVLNKKTYKVFNNKDEFFKYFNILEKDKMILELIFPEEYFTTIDNVTSDINIKDVMKVIIKIKIDENDVETNF